MERFVQLVVRCNQRWSCCLVAVQSAEAFKSEHGDGGVVPRRDAMEGVTRLDKGGRWV